MSRKNGRPNPPKKRKVRATKPKGSNIQPLAGPFALWWLSYAGARGRKLGVAIVSARHALEARGKARELGLTPKGTVETMGYPLDKDSELAVYEGRFLGVEEAEGLGARKVREG